MRARDYKERVKQQVLEIGAGTDRYIVKRSDEVKAHVCKARTSQTARLFRRCAQYVRRWT